MAGKTNTIAPKVVDNFSACTGASATTVYPAHLPADVSNYDVA